jgi:putative Mn2+ efflux pump MntP
MPITGLFIGGLFGRVAGTMASHIGAGLLILLGIAMIWRALTAGFKCPPLLHRSLPALAAVSLGVSLDALAVGVGYALSARGVSIIPTSTVIGVVAFGMTIAGAEIGSRVGVFAQHRAPVLGGAILVALGAMSFMGVR